MLLNILQNLRESLFGPPDIVAPLSPENIDGVAVTAHAGAGDRCQAAALSGCGITALNQGT